MLRHSYALLHSQQYRSPSVNKYIPHHVSMPARLLAPCGGDPSLRDSVYFTR